MRDLFPGSSRVLFVKTVNKQSVVISTITLLSTIYKRTTESTRTLPSALPTVQITINDSLWKAGLLTQNKRHSTVACNYLHHTNDLLTTTTKQTNNRHFTNNRPTHFLTNKRRIETHQSLFTVFTANNITAY